MRPSIRRRLLTLSLASTLLIVGGSGTLVWILTKDSLLRSLDESLHTEALALASRLETDDGRIHFEMHQGRLLAVIPGRDAIAWILDHDGQVVFSSPMTEGARPPAAFVERPRGPRSVEWFDADIFTPPQHCRVVTLRVSLDIRVPDSSPAEDGAETVTGATVFVARSVGTLAETLTRLAAVLTVVAVVAGLAALLLGWLVARTGTAPIRAVARELGRVDPGSPGFALEPGTVPIELDPIVGTVGDLLARIRVEMERQRQLTADVAHDLRTPLAGVRTLLDVCLGRPREKREYLQAIEKAGHALRGLSNLVGDVLSMARLEAGIDKPIRESVSIQDLVASAIEVVQPMASARDVVIFCKDDRTGELRSDRVMLTKALNNLLGNAVEHSPPGETVRIGIRREGALLEIAVEDHGPGIPPQVQERIFERFVRGDGARVADSHHGLGLPIARGLARILGGDVRLASSSPGGSRFVLTVSAV